MKHCKLSLIITLLAAMSIIACKKETEKEDQNNNNQTPTGTFYLHFHTNIDSNEVDSGAIGADANGRRFQLNYARFYVSGVTLKKADGNYITIENAFALKTIEQEQYLIGKVPVGNYVSVSFNVGVDSVNNAKSPSSFDAGSPLYTQDPPMWYGSVTTGYIFMHVSGLADTTATNNGQVNFPFSYKIGSNALLRKVVMPDKAFTVSANSGQEAHIACDYGKLLEGIDFRTKSTTDTYTINPLLAVQIAGNISNMFSYEE